jgi:hypothetical protein
MSGLILVFLLRSDAGYSISRFVSEWYMLHHYLAVFMRIKYCAKTGLYETSLMVWSKDFASEGGAL